MLFVLGTLVQVRIPRETFAAVALVDFFRGDTAFLLFMHVPADGAVDVPRLWSRTKRDGSGSKTKEREAWKGGTAYGSLGLLRTTDGFPLASDISEERSTGRTIVTFLLRCLRIPTTPVDGLVELAPGGGDGRSSEEGDGYEGFDRGHGGVWS